MKGEKAMRPDYNRAATMAAKTLIDYNVTAAPVDPMPILKQLKGVLLFSFTEVSECIGIEREPAGLPDVSRE